MIILVIIRIVLALIIVGSLIYALIPKNKKKDKNNKHNKCVNSSYYCHCCGNTVRTAKGSELIFISWIKRDGSGTIPIVENTDSLNDTVFQLASLSITNKTLIASEFNSYVVKFKPK